MEKKNYFRLGRAADVSLARGYYLFRFLETVPGIMLWATLAGIIFISWRAPAAASLFIVIFDAYWLLKTIFLSWHLRASYKKMKQHLKLDWLAKLEEIRAYNPQLKVENWRDIYHLVILPFYKEPYGVVRGSLEAIQQAHYPKDKIILVLGVEERAGEEARFIASRLGQEFSRSFFKFIISEHPTDIAGEIPGKGANETWAAREAKEKIIDSLGIQYEQVLVSSFDIDTRIYPHYFGVITYHYLTTAHPLRSSYQPIPIYNNNIWDAPFFSRVVASSGTFWQMMQQARAERLSTFSSHSIPLKPLVEMNYWQTNIVSEDSRIFWQSLLFYDGDWRTVPLFYPVSMDANVGRTLGETVKNVYKQQRRWGWGVENFPYLVFGFLKNKKISFRPKLYWSFVQLEGFWSWATNALIIFLLGWLPLILGGAKFNVTVLSYNLPRITRLLMTLSMAGIITSAIISSSLLPPRPPHKKKYLWLSMILQWAFLPLTIITFGSVPGIDAQTRLMLGKYMSFWVTPKLRNPRSNQHQSL
ncbi:MAG: glycosyltransferase family 2 protein [Candidatus Sungiibacteriota bacterium]|uniref:Glycosyltransferase family 2 protein n=1 Tax=Candidatus Sungiibacteriota bacterium TaxID=2750080 RepID=A0A7T5RK58_9BACT|nr:MAG: glycosyltransferase family 2 protein [Candidatus Sungbacteria bacterium]